VLALQETSKQHAAYRNLILRHIDRPASALASMSAPNAAAPTALLLPFILIQVNPEASVEIQIADDNRQAMFDFAGCVDHAHSRPACLHECAAGSMCCCSWCTLPLATLKLLLAFRSWHAN